MAWGRRRRSYLSIPTQRIEFDAKAYYKLRNSGEKGESVTITLKCDGSKMHKVTFFERGDIHLHDHNLKAERALWQLANEDGQRLPRCVELTKLWKQGLTQFMTTEHDISKRMMRITGTRHFLERLHTEVKYREDADGFDVAHHKRLLAIIAGKEERVRDRILEVFKHPAEHSWETRNYPSDYTQKAQINTDKVKLTTKGIGAPSDFRGKHPPSKPTKPKVLPILKVDALHMKGAKPAMHVEMDLGKLEQNLVGWFKTGV